MQGALSEILIRAAGLAALAVGMVLFWQRSRGSPVASARPDEGNTHISTLQSEPGITGGDDINAPAAHDSDAIPASDHLTRSGSQDEPGPSQEREDSEHSTKDETVSDASTGAQSIPCSEPAHTYELREAGVHDEPRVEDGRPAEASLVLSELVQILETGAGPDAGDSIAEISEHVPARVDENDGSGTSNASPSMPPRPKPAKHRDRRGQRRRSPAKVERAETIEDEPIETHHLPPAEVGLRLILHPLRRTVSLSAMPARPPGYPSSITLLIRPDIGVGAYDESRYDDVDLDWTPDLLSSELRLDSAEGLQWLRSARRIHIFGEMADEPGLKSVGSATAGANHSIVCRLEDAESVRLAARSCGSSDPISLDRWSGIPNGWTVLSGYRPAHTASPPLDASLTSLDPGIGTMIEITGGLRIRALSFAQGSSPRITIAPLSVGASVAIDGVPAIREDNGAWIADGWDRPGEHLVDVVPGPSATYRIVADPWQNGGWEFWDAHPGRFTVTPAAPWARVQVCGASTLGPSGENVVAAETAASVIALGVRRGCALLRPRPDVPVSIGLLAEPPAFLISASGPRRKQGHVTWLVPAPAEAASRAVDLSWVAAVRSAASRRLPLINADEAGQDAWRSARERARRYRRARR